MARTGRPKKQIDQDQFEKLCGIQCTEQEIASFFDCDISTLSRWCKNTYGSTFEDIAKKKASIGKISLRRTQWKQAERSERMAIWLGKQYLGQTDKMEATVAQIDDNQRQAIEDFLNVEDTDRPATEITEET